MQVTHLLDHVQIPSKKIYSLTLCINLQIGTDVEQFSKTKAPCYTQPFLLVLMHGSHAKEHFLIVDNTSIPVGSDSLDAFDKLYKAFYVFHVDYPPCLESFYNFFDGVIYEISTQIKPPVRAKYGRMMAMSNVE